MKLKALITVLLTTSLTLSYAAETEKDELPCTEPIFLAIQSSSSSQAVLEAQRNGDDPNPGCSLEHSKQIPAFNLYRIQEPNLADPSSAIGCFFRLHVEEITQHLSPKDLQTFARTCKCNANFVKNYRRLHFLSINCFRKTLDQFKDLLLKNSKIYHLSLKNYQDQHLIFLHEWMSKNQLLSLALVSSSRITDDRLAHLEGMPLISLKLVGSWEITDKGLAHLEGMPLISVKLVGCREITDYGLAHLEGMSLTFLSLDECNRITDYGLAHLKGMPLAFLSLEACNRITDYGLAHLKGMPLTELNLSWCIRITDEGLAYLAEMPLTSLILDHCWEITDAGLAYLAEMPLTSLILDHCNQITDEGLAHLKKMPLKLLKINVTKITYYAIDQVRKDHPGIKIYR